MSYCRILYSLAFILIGTLANAQHLPPSAPQKVVVLTAGEAWKAGVKWTEQEGIQAHTEYYREAVKKRQAVSFGPRTDAPGAVIVPTATLSTKALQVLVSQDPAVKSGVLRAEIIEWTPSPGIEPPAPASRSSEYVPPVEEKKQFPRSSGKSPSGRSKPPAFEN